MKENMLPHKERMYIELIELLPKVFKLGIFLNTETFKSLHIDEQTDLEEQYKHMEAYANTLARRVNKFNK